MSWHLFEFNGENKEEINLKLTLNCGQAFRWQFHQDEWRCAFKDFIVRLKQDEDFTVYFYSTDDTFEHMKIFLADYFRSSENLSCKYKLWASTDSYFESVYKNYLGIRLLRQDPVENLYSFICSSNNAISRISSLVRALADNFGLKQYIIDSNGQKNCYSSFPSVSALHMDNLEEKLRQLKFGYRAKYIKNTTDLLHIIGGEEKLQSLRKEKYEDSKKYLLTLPGVGAKVADCVLLGSLDKHDAVPIDIHMFHVIKKYYAHKFDSQVLNAKTLTPLIYETIRSTLTKIWKPYSGWAQLIVFASDLSLKSFEKNEKTFSSKRKGSDGNFGKVVKK